MLEEQRRAAAAVAGFVGWEDAAAPVAPLEATAERTALAAAEPPAAAAKPERVQEWQLSRREKRIAANVLARREQKSFRFDWMTPDDESRSPAELEALDRKRSELLATVRRQDGSPVTRLESVLSPPDKHVVRCIRDNPQFAGMEWGKLWRADHLLANLALEACWGVREDGTCAREWHSQRARNMLAIVWMCFRVGSTRRAEVGELRVRGLCVDFVRKILATDGKDALHRNTLGGTHRTGSARNEDVGYFVALELAGVFTRVQYGDRRNNQQVQEFHLRISTEDERVAAALERNEAAFRQWVDQRWQRLSQLDALRVLPWRAHARYLREREAEKLDEIRRALSDELVEPPS
jgi:hypothetical protein